MALPASFARDGFFPSDRLVGKHKGLLIGTDGWPNTGKTEFGLSAPGPGIVICLDRGYDAMLDNPNPPESRSPDFAFKVIAVPLALQATQPDYVVYWRDFYATYRKALENPDCRTVVLDGDSDSWELQRLAEFGKLTQVPSIMYTNVNAARRGMIARAFDSGKIVIATNKLKEEYAVIRNAKGEPTDKREKTGGAERQGFSDQDYLWHLQLRHMRDDVKGFGVKIMMCKANTVLHGFELWGEECNFRTLVQVVYPNVPMERWGF